MAYESRRWYDDPGAYGLCVMNVNIIIEILHVMLSLTEYQKKLF